MAAPDQARDYGLQNLEFGPGTFSTVSLVLSRWHSLDGTLSMVISRLVSQWYSLIDTLSTTLSQISGALNHFG